MLLVASVQVLHLQNLWTERQVSGNRRRSRVVALVPALLALLASGSVLAALQPAVPAALQPEGLGSRTLYPAEGLSLLKPCWLLAVVLLTHRHLQWACYRLMLSGCVLLLYRGGSCSCTLGLASPSGASAHPHVCRCLLLHANYVFRPTAVVLHAGLCFRNPAVPPLALYLLC
jgi:hypothetical protein